MDNQRNDRESGLVKPLLAFRKLLTALSVVLLGLCIWKAVQQRDPGYVAVGVVALIPIVSFIASRLYRSTE